MSGQVIDRIDLPDAKGSIVLYDWMSDDVKDGRNLVKVDPEGHTLWKATPPTRACKTASPGCSGTAKPSPPNTWSGYRVGIDLQSGGTTVLKFTK